VVAVDIELHTGRMEPRNHREQVGRHSMAAVAVVGCMICIYSSVDP